MKHAALFKPAKRGHNSASNFFFFFFLCLLLFSVLFACVSRPFNSPPHDTPLLTAFSDGAAVTQAAGAATSSHSPLTSTMYSTHEPPYPSSHVPYDSHAQFPRLPNIMPASYPPADTTQDHDDAAPESPPYTQSPHYDPRGRRNSYGRNDGPSQLYNPFADPEAIPLQQQHPKIVAASNVTEPVNTYDGPSHYVPQQNSPPRRKERFLSWKTPWVVYVLTIIQIAVFIAELIKNATLTHSPIEIHPQFNPMIGPSPYVLINMGARYVGHLEPSWRLDKAKNNRFPA